MGTMQARFSFYTKSLLITVMVLGGFVVQSPTSAANSLSTIPADHDPQEVMNCNQTGCMQQHNNCQEHCLSQSSDKMVAAVLTVTNSQIVVDTPVRAYSLPRSTEKTAFEATPNRAPPTQKLIRSVMKRE